MGDIPSTFYQLSSPLVIQGRFFYAGLLYLYKQSEQPGRPPSGYGHNRSVVHPMN